MAELNTLTYEGPLPDESLFGSLLKGCTAGQCSLKLGASHLILVFENAWKVRSQILLAIAADKFPARRIGQQGHVLPPVEVTANTTDFRLHIVQHVQIALLIHLIPLVRQASAQVSEAYQIFFGPSCSNLEQPVLHLRNKRKDYAK